MNVDLAALFLATHRSVVSAAGPEEAWRGVLAAVDATGCTVPASIRAHDIDAAVAALARALSTVLASEAPPESVNFLHFGLFDAWNPEEATAHAGLYLAGGIGDPERALANGQLAYRPRAGLLFSRLLDSIKAAAPPLGDDYNVFDYGLMFGATAVLARYAVREAGSPLAATVGFDSGDYAQVL